MMNEEIKLSETRDRTRHWKHWGPYLSERAWSTVREDCSSEGNAWDCLPITPGRELIAGMKMELRASVVAVS